MVPPTPASGIGPISDRPRTLLLRGHSGTLAQPRLLSPDTAIPLLPGHVSRHDQQEDGDEHPANVAVLGERREEGSKRYEPPYS